MKSRIRYIVLMITTMVIGLVSRSDVLPMPIFVATYAGDTLWALMVFWGLRAFSPSTKIFTSALLAVGFAFTIEFSQLYQSPWINSLRATTLGGLVLGFGFLRSDLLCYLVGITFGSLINLLVLHYRSFTIRFSL